MKVKRNFEITFGGACCGAFGGDEMLHIRPECKKHLNMRIKSLVFFKEVVAVEREQNR